MKKNNVRPEAATGKTTANEIKINRAMNVFRSEFTDGVKWLIESFDEMMRHRVKDDFERRIEYLKQYEDVTGKNEYVSGIFYYDFDYEYEWKHFVWGQSWINPFFAGAVFREYGEKFINEYSMGDYVEDLADEYGVDLEYHRCEECFIWVKNSHYTGSIPDSVLDSQYVIVADCEDGKFGFDDLDYAVAIRNEHCFGNDVAVSVYLVQKGMNEYGVAINRLIECVE